MMEIMDKHQNRADDLAENAPKFIRPIGPKVWDILYIVEKRPHQESVVRMHTHHVKHKTFGTTLLRT